jgi:hypothetical protein
MAFLVALIAGIKTSIGIFISDLCLSCLNGNKHKRIDNAVNAILKNNFIEMRKDEGNFKKQVLIENIHRVDVGLFCKN